MHSTQQINVTLPDEMAAQVRAKVASGAYTDESDVILEGLRALDARERTIEAWLREDVLASYDAYVANPGSGLSLEEVRASIGKRN